MQASLGPSFPAATLLKADTGITRFYSGFRRAVPKFVGRHRSALARCFAAAAASSAGRSERKVSNVFAILDALPPLRNRSAEIKIHSAVTPALACLDPQRLLPIANSTTRGLLARLGHDIDGEGAAALVNRVRPLGFKDAFELDVYAHTQFARWPKSRKVKTGASRSFAPSATGPKSEATAIVKLKARLVRIRKRHNQLTRRFREYLPHYDVFDSGARYDLLINPWRKGKALLVEAKVDSAGVAGRMQVRTAVGQLLDYRREHFHKIRNQIVLALLLPKKPKPWVIDLLGDIDAEVLWLEKGEVKGTIEV
jgi:hypothetical protein